MKSFFASLAMLSFMVCNSQNIPSMAPNEVSNKKMQGNWIIWYNSKWLPTTIRDSAAYYRKITFLDDKPIGKVTDYYKSGKKQWEGTLYSFEPELIDGLAIWYHENGNKNVVRTFKKGLQQGLETYYFESGKTESKTNFTDGIKTGRVEVFYENGKKQVEGFYREGEKSGKWYWYYENGNRAIEKEYKNDQLNGRYLEYDKTGKVIKQEAYIDGKLKENPASDNSDFLKKDLEKVENYLVLNVEKIYREGIYFLDNKIINKLGLMYTETQQYKHLSELLLPAKKKDSQGFINIVFDRVSLNKFPILLYLIINAKSIGTPEEKQGWANLLPLMNDKQKNNLIEILLRETIKLEAIELKYDVAKKIVKYKYLQKWSVQKPDEKSKKDLTIPLLDLQKDILKFLKFNESLVYISRKTLAEKQFRMQCLQIEAELNSVMYAAGNFLQSDSLLEKYYNILFLLKGITLENSILLKKSVLESDNPILAEKYREYLWVLDEIGNLGRTQSLGLIKNPVLANRYDSLTVKANTIEKYIMQESIEFQNYLTQYYMHWSEIKKNLNSGEIAIDISSADVDDTATYYGAFLIKKEWEFPKFVRLFEEKQLTQIFTATSANKNAFLYRGTNGLILTGQYNSDSINLYKLIWQPLEKYLAGVTTVYYAPAGLLNRINLPAIITPTKNRLMDNFEIHQLLTIRSITNNKTGITENMNNVWLFGGINYDSSNKSRNTSINNSRDTFTLKKEKVNWAEQRGAGLEKFEFLPGTLAEVVQITSLLKQNKVKIKLITDADATEETLKQIGYGTPKPGILHIATHGYYIPINNKKSPDSLKPHSKKNDEMELDNPLVRNGLIMAGANKGLKKDSQQRLEEKTEDGFLTSQEISGVDLRGCKLAVLSACQTAMGEIKGSEGVFGLQRAFKMAGVEKLLLSLWSIDDEKTQEFMVDFYSQLININDISKAFANVQKKFITKYPNPYYWAAFVLIE